MECELDTVKDILELFYLVSGPLLVFIAYKALDQIKVSKEIAKTNSKREAFKITLEEIRYYSNQIIPIVHECDELVEKHKIKFITESKIVIGQESIQLKYFYEGNHAEQFEKLLNPGCKLLNSLSDFSAIMTSGIADESLAYNNLAETYCGTVKKYAALIFDNDSNKDKDTTLKLFLIWNNRLEKERIILEKKKLEEQIKNNNDESINVIGT